MFVAGEARWDQSTLVGRLKHFIAQEDPRLLLYTPSTLKQCRDLIQDHVTGKTTVPEDELWRAQYAIYARIHPDTGQAVNPVFSVPGFAPACIPVCALMVTPAGSAIRGALLQTLNQTMNAGFNYCNRNATNAVSTTQLLGGYVGAVSSAIAVAYKLRTVIANSKRFTPALKRTLESFLPFPAVATANIFNCVLMRNGELFTGIEVYNTDGTTAGTSHKAARLAIAYTALSRVVMPIPVFVIPAAGNAILERKTDILKRFPKMSLPITLLFTSLGLYIGVPLAVACFPQTCRLRKGEVEEGVQCTGDYVTFNKGL